jgi:hypothetical protein
VTRGEFLGSGSRAEDEHPVYVSIVFLLENHCGCRCQHLGDQREVKPADNPGNERRNEAVAVPVNVSTHLHCSVGKKKF